MIGDFVTVYNNRRLHAGISYLRPVDMFEGRGKQVLAKRKSRLESARALRILKNKQLREVALSTILQ